MMRTVNAVASASAIARKVKSPLSVVSALNASSGPYALEERPSAPRPTYAIGGFGDQAQFSRHFRAHFGCTAQQMRAAAKAGTHN